MRGIRWFSLAILVGSTSISLAADTNQMPWQPNLETAQHIAAQSHRLVLIPFWGPSCKPCMRLEQEVFSHAEVARALESNFVLVRLNVEEAPGTARLYGVSSIPTDVIISPSGRLVAQLQSPPTANQYVAQMNQAAVGHRELLRQVAVTQTQQAAATAQAPAAQQSVAMAPNGGTAGAPGTGATVPPNGTPGAQATATTDRYGEYFRQHPGAAGPNAAVPDANSAAQSQLAVAGQGFANAQVSAAQHVQVPAEPPQLPQGCPPLGLSGYCPVTMVERKAWAMGDKAWGVVHRGRTYLFLGPQEKDKFLADPDRYSPVMSGLDPVLALDNQLSVPGKREFGVFLGGRIYLFADEASLQRFQQNPKRYAAEALQAMR